MFHRASTSPEPIVSENNQNEGGTKTDNKSFYKRVDSSSLERYAKSQEEIKKPLNSANQNYNMPPQQASLMTQNQTEYSNEKEVSYMNNPEPQKKENSQDDNNKPAMAAQGRDVNIPGNNFQRPGMPASRPVYPGSYAANAAANNPYAAQQNKDNGRKLVIGQGITMSGEIESCEHLIVEGTIEATLKGASVLDVYESGAFLGTVEIDQANIAGRFEGDLTVRGRLTIEASGVVIGSVSYKELSMEAGATLDGSVSPIGSENAAKLAKKPTMPNKAKKASSNNGAELPFSDKSGEAAE